MIKGFLIYFLLFATLCFGQSFERHFEDKTLRLDYIFGGDANQQYVFLDELVSYPKWYGRKHELDQHILRGEGQIRVYDKASGEIIFVNSFSTLFQEWLSVPEAKERQNSFENVFLIPFPKRVVEVKIVMFDDYGHVVEKSAHTIDPKDILINQKGNSALAKQKVIHEATDKSKVINVAIVAEGYTEEEMGEFLIASKTTVDAILSHEPFGKYAANFNFTAVESISEDSGVSQPSRGIWKKTAVGSNFDTFYSARYLTTKRVKLLHDVLAGTPYDHIIILANSDVYGGGGIYNGYTITSVNHSLFKPVVVHEFGHSFAGLADEYFYPNDVLSELVGQNQEPWQRNITTLNDFDKKWGDLLQKGTPIPTPLNEQKKYPNGVYEGLEGNGIYKSSLTCRMFKNDDKSFCSVCQQAVEELLLFYTK